MKGPGGVVVKVLDCGQEVGVFKLESRYCVYFRSD